MALCRRMAAPFFLVLLIIVAAETATARVVVEEKHCLSQSHSFSGMCFSHTNCDNVCKTEKFTGGKCKMDGTSRKCFCLKFC
ncbi:hypothetical protein BDA96_04G140400 [Sorghum bicolor]|uniref:Knottins-like domain-containing protein n=2 Tax=Sorghum bicolor TaxID=4558 RepID=A0A921UK76_SORBI|nr:defensin Tk-AMP-D1 [Sorghum bicolor]EES04959.1 hypothetical protein SORBI_3004G131400 [Sorghum bicolor]KAG0532826.1 hypothetical protein BDA96_04G140400 [Sorghum bicolor]|eukprot:XP_002451983.1 defensin Tk-AMP-D1 [Sorghum bicolor]